MDLLQEKKMKVEFINSETALMKMEEIHKNVNSSDEFEKILYNQIIEVAGIISDAYGVLDVPKKEMEKDLKKLLEIYFEAADQFVMK